MNRQKRIRKLAKWTYAARSASNQEDVDLFVGHLMSMGAAESEIRRAVAVLLKSKQVRLAIPPKAHVPMVGSQVDGVEEAPALQTGGEVLSEVSGNGSLATEGASNRGEE